MRAMYLRKMKLLVAMVLALGLIVGGGAWWHQHAANAAPGGPRDEPARPAPGPVVPAAAKEDAAGEPASDKDERRDLVDVASPREGIVQFVGTEVAVKPGEKAPAGAFKHEMAYLVTPADNGAKGERFEIGGKSYRRVGRREEVQPNKLRIYWAEKWFVPLKVGDKVEPGQLIALTDPALAVDELSIKLAKFDAAAADHSAAEKMRDEYKERYQRLKSLFEKAAVGNEDVTAAKLAWERTVFEAISKTEALKVAERELQKARTELEMHQVRSRVRGVVTKVARHPGEGAKALDAIVQVRLEDR